ncbi:MAG: hypothetical protein Q9194_007177, partial [Teloschistes cf. exilis]
MTSSPSISPPSRQKHASYLCYYDDRSTEAFPSLRPYHSHPSVPDPRPQKMAIAPSPNDDETWLTATSSTNNTSTTSGDAFLTFPSFSTKSLRIKTNSDAQARQDRAAAIQTAKREVLANIRHDWTWPSLPEYSQSDSFPRKRKSTQWREREYDSPPEPTRLPSPTPPNPYKFESPDAVGAAAEPAKKRKFSNDEVESNTGLKVFMARRDYWTGAERRPLRKDSGGGMKPWPSTTASSGVPLETKARTRTQAATTPPLEAPTCTSSSLEETASTSPTSTDSFTAPSASLASSTLEPTPTPASSTQGRSSTTISDDIEAIQSQTPSTTPEEHATTTLIPLAPPLLSPADHPLLPTITPASYPTIYSKVIVQSLAPS